MTRTLALSLVVAALTLGCTHRQAAAPSQALAPAASTATPGGAPGMPGMAGMCPLDVPGTQVAASDTDAGEALTFTTTPDQVSALRERVHAMAEMHNAHHAGAAGAPGGAGAEGAGTGSGAMPGGMMGGGDAGEGGMHGGMPMPPPSRAAVEDLPEGARLTVTPNDPADLQRLQTTMRTHAERMQQQGCQMMGGQQ